MRAAILFVPLCALLAACGSSGDDHGGGGTTSPSSQSPSSLEPTDGSAPLSKVTIAIQGNGAVVSRDTVVDCKSDGSATTGACGAYYETTLYAMPSYGWSFSHWEPAASGSSALLVTLATPAELTAVFTKD